MLIEQVGSRSADTCDVNRASGRSVGHYLRCESSKFGERSTDTCDVNRASGRSVGHYLRCESSKCRWRSAIACLVEYFREVVAEYFQHFDKNASLKPHWLGEERVRDFIDFSCNRT